MLNFWCITWPVFFKGLIRIYLDSRNGGLNISFINPLKCFLDRKGKGQTLHCKSRTLIWNSFYVRGIYRNFEFWTKKLYIFWELKFSKFYFIPAPHIFYYIYYDQKNAQVFHKLSHPPICFDTTVPYSGNSYLVVTYRCSTTTSTYRLYLQPPHRRNSYEL